MKLPVNQFFDRVMMVNKFYITTAIDYINDTIHIGHAFQKLVADVLARYQRIKLGRENVFFLTGTDEYGQKAEKAAKEAKLLPKEFADKISDSDKKEQDSLNISYDRFIRTTDPDHTGVVQEIWRRIDKAGDIYLGEYTGLYCEGCEAYYTQEDLIDGHCPFHPTLQIKQIAEKNYFFKWSKYRDFLINHIKSNPKFIIPENRKNEMIEFAKKIKDIPISRSNFKWGIPVPNDPEQVIYVWFDALTNYLTGVNFLEDSKKFNKFWPADIHILGKDNARWHALLWPAMLNSAGIKLPKTILVNGFLSLNGQKISKSIGNVIRPSDWVNEFGVDAVRYYLIGHTNITEDSDISRDKLIMAYNSDLANGLGNLFERVLTIILDHGINIGTQRETEISKKAGVIQKQYDGYFNQYNPSEALRTIFTFMKDLDRYINDVKPLTQDFW
ncbi:MAG: methionine--tRNA ligase [Candidatus Wolfebacteria bacterium]|nr:methionine--tRNA ligase [Candidatus Wolfebacteria bacterium]